MARTEADKRSESAAQQQDQALPAGVPVQADQVGAMSVLLQSRISTISTSAVMLR